MTSEDEEQLQRFLRVHILKGADEFLVRMIDKYTAPVMKEYITGQIDAYSSDVTELEKHVADLEATHRSLRSRMSHVKNGIKELMDRLKSREDEISRIFGSVSSVWMRCVNHFLPLIGEQTAAGCQQLGIKGDVENLVTNTGESAWTALIEKLSDCRNPMGSIATAFASLSEGWEAELATIASHRATLTRMVDVL